MKHVIFLLFFAGSTVTHADSFQPSAQQTITLTAPLPLTAQMQQLTARTMAQPNDNDALNLAALYLAGSRQPGFDAWFHQAQYWLSQVTEANHNNIEYPLLQADILQQQHQFAAALASLEPVFSRQPGHLTASLMAARIYLATAQHQSAQQACNRLWQRDLFLFSVCSYEVAGRSGQWQQSYQALQLLYQRQQNIPTQIDLWLRGILAEQAEQSGDIKAATAWLTPVLAKAPTSLWLKWADLSLALNQHHQVYQRLLPKHQQFGLADSLLVRLAVAEQQLAADTGISAELAERMQLRLIRGDTDHAADLAHYFLRVAPDPQAALHWAELNYQSAKEPDDIALLRQSKRALTYQQGIPNE
ncbi:tetratricopeptide repeat protein [Arsukibacterium sp.]|uniref:tetratricopeptide repeat protein n=1 Tax=Arsukibacterium sp. TaxID=1977258 RepID=UPI00299D4306|nr:tetratricopeptide repeat protein [Arsukibacterium sp.]MDX1538069.1 tetratricopeptide repeat protein [Arsukibacterium sp.]